MLDLMTLGLSMGAQEDLTKAREESGAVVHNEEAASSCQEETVLSQAVDAVGATLSVVESAVTTAVGSLVPNLDNAPTLTAPTVDLTLPTSQVAAKK